VGSPFAWRVVDNTLEQIPIRVVRHTCAVEWTERLGRNEVKRSSRVFHYEVSSKEGTSVNWSCWTHRPVRFTVHCDPAGKTYISYINFCTVHLFLANDNNEGAEMLRSYLACEAEGEGIILDPARLVGEEPFQGGLNALHCGMKVDEVNEENGKLRVGVTGEDASGRTHHFSFELRDHEWHLVKSGNQ
jgi:hypothetical protein